MSGYLQRLLDRTAPAPPAEALIPAGLSHSPISLSDQRLNDPAFAEHLTMPSVPEPDDTTDLPVAAMPQPVRRREAPATDLALPARKPAVVVAPPEADISSAPPAMATEADAPTPASPHPNPVGLVAPEELVLPEPKIQAQKEIKPDPADTVTTQTTPRTNIDPPLPEPPNPVPQPTESAVSSEPPALHREPPHPVSPLKTLVPVEPAPDVPVFKVSAEAPTVEARKPPIETLPPQVIVPVSPDSPVFAPRQPEPHPASPPADASTERPEPLPLALRERQNRPMTAAEVSVIGPLHPRCRALTLFGLRRR